MTRFDMAVVDDNSGDWRVGVLFSQTEVTQAIERTQLNATLLAIEEINSNGGGRGMDCPSGARTGLAAGLCLGRYNAARRDAEPR